MIDHYHVLNIAPQASAEEIRKAFRKEAKKCHPDLDHSGSLQEKQKRQKQFVLLTQAYETLSNVSRRQEYDRKFQKRTSQHQKPRSNTSSSYQSYARSRSKPPPEKPWPHFEDPDEETLDDLLKDVEDILSKFGLQFRDPLEILMDWARKVFQEFVTIWDEDDPQPKKKQSFTQSEKRYSMFEDIEEELRKLKQKVETHTSSQNQQKTTKARHQASRKSAQTREIDRELHTLKKKYGRSL